jgi:hypothetical protein
VGFKRQVEVAELKKRIAPTEIEPVHKGVENQQRQ